MHHMFTRSILRTTLLLSGLLAFPVVSASAQQADNVGGTSFGNFGSGGAYGDFDLAHVGATGGVASSGASGNYGNPTAASAYVASPSQDTGRQNGRDAGMGRLRLPRTRVATLDRIFGHGLPLPPTRLDSFVRNSAAQADLIYGDEGTTSIPPYFGFDESHRIETGMHSPGLTTGHRGSLPSAWGYPQ